MTISAGGGMLRSNPTPTAGAASSSTDDEDPVLPLCSSFQLAAGAKGPGTATVTPASLGSRNRYGCAATIAAAGTIPSLSSSNASADAAVRNPAGESSREEEDEADSTVLLPALAGAGAGAAAAAWR